MDPWQQMGFSQSAGEKLGLRQAGNLGIPLVKFS